MKKNDWGRDLDFCILSGKVGDGAKEKLEWGVWSGGS